MRVIAVEHDVFEKLDIEPIAQELASVNIAILYSCTNDDAWQDEQWEDGGQVNFLIKLPYRKVKRMKKENVTKLMLEYARERLRQVA